MGSMVGPQPRVRDCSGRAAAGRRLPTPCRRRVAAASPAAHSVGAVALALQPAPTGLQGLTGWELCAKRCGTQGAGCGSTGRPVRCRGRAERRGRSRPALTRGGNRPPPRRRRKSPPGTPPARRAVPPPGRPPPSLSQCTPASRRRRVRRLVRPAGCHSWAASSPQAAIRPLPQRRRSTGTSAGRLGQGAGSPEARLYRGGGGDGGGQRDVGCCCPVGEGKRVGPCRHQRQHVGAAT